MKNRMYAEDDMIDKWSIPIDQSRISVYQAYKLMMTRPALGVCCTHAIEHCQSNDVPFARWLKA